MTDKKKDKYALIAPIVRGLLAELSKDDNDPYHRVVLTLCTEKEKNGELPVLQLDSLNISGDTEKLRNRVGNIISKYMDQYNSKPEKFSFPEIGIFKIKREIATLEYPLQNKVALVTGAAGAIGAGICRVLLEKGCNVAATDISIRSLDELVNELRLIADDRIIGVPIDVTNINSVKKGFQAVTYKWGGIDIVAVNAGIAMVASIMEMDLDQFRKVEKVNIEGTLLTLAEAGKCLCQQGTGGDIIITSTKNVFSPGAQFGAYSATKAASHQLGRIASLEFSPFDIRVNMVSPDAVFYDGIRKSGLWEAVGPSRMKARGLDEKGLEEYYRNRNLLQVRVTSEHVAKAVLFFAMRQTPTTGATFPVDGGLPDATPR